MKPTTKIICNKAHCKCMNLGGNCPNHHYQDSCYEQPTTNNLEWWEEWEIKLVEIIENIRFTNCEKMWKLKQLILDLRKHDMEELIKLFEEKCDIGLAKKIIKEYYEK